MNLYLLERRERADWDECKGFVVRAESEADARMLAEAQRGCEACGTWTWSHLSTCEQIGVADGGDAEVVLRSFNAG